ncbi:hypothetical protein M426DRAFT_316519 [Hypoxylon sp. CI-4A]|nr:hypothetical protein M426DRAFT_316519 [Hypoxylon sp. CI-4A]
MPFHPSQWHFEIDHYLNPWLPAAPWRHIPYPVAHFMGYRPQGQRPVGNLAMVFWAFIGVFCSLIIIEATSRAIPSFRAHDAPIIVGSFGAAAVLEFYVVESPLSQPRNAVLGQILSSIVGIAISKLFALGPVSRDLTWLGGALACACSVAVMGLTGTVHPPAGATALLAVVDDNLSNLGWFLLPIILLGCVLMQCVALLLNNIQRRFPVYWWTPAEVGHHKKRQQEERPDGKSSSDSGSSDSGSENGAKLETTRTRHMEEGRLVEEKERIVITRMCVNIPDTIYLSPEDTAFLEGLSERLRK